MASLRDQLPTAASIPTAEFEPELASVRGEFAVANHTIDKLRAEVKMGRYPMDYNFPRASVQYS